MLEAQDGSLCESSRRRIDAINNIEVGRFTGDPKTLELIEQTLSRAGVEFIDENGGGPGVRLRKRLKSRG